MMQNWKHELEELLYHLGIYLSQDGYPVICAAADLVLQEPERLRRLMTGVYLEVAKRCGCTAASVERSLRTTVATAWEANPTLFQKMAMREITQPPTAGDFLCMVRHYLQQVITCSRFAGNCPNRHRGPQPCGPQILFLDFLKSSKENLVDRMKGNRDNVQFAQRQRGCFICSVN